LIGDIVVDGDLVYVAVGNFTEEPGALIMVDIADPGAPSVVWEFATPGAARCVVIDGRYAYLGLVDPADPTGGMLQVVDLFPQTGPTETALEPIPGWPEEITHEENVVWITDLGRGARAFNVANPTRPTESGFLEGNIRDHDMNNERLYLIEWVDGGGSILRILDVTDPTNPAELGTYDTGRAHNLRVSGSTAYILRGSSVSIRLEIVSTSSPDNPTSVGALSLAAPQAEIFAHDLAVSSRRILLTHSLGGPSIVDAFDYSELRLAGSFESAEATNAVSVGGELVGLASGHSGVALFELSDLWTDHPQPRSWWRGSYARDVVLSEDLGFVAGWFDGIRILDVSDPDGPTELAAIESAYPVFRLVLDGDYLYASYYGNPYVETAIFDVSDPEHPVQVSGLQGSVLAVAEGFAYADWSDWLGQCALATWDVGDPTDPVDQPTHVKFWGACARCDWPWPGFDRPFELDPHRAIAGFASWASQAWVALGQGGLKLLDLSDPSQPVQIASLDVNACGVSSAVATRNTAYVATNAYSGVLVVRGSDSGGVVHTSTLPIAGFPSEITNLNGLLITANTTTGMSVMSTRGCLAPLRASGRIQ
jgi:hypothetical protein